MQRKHNKQLTPLAKKLRREMTKEERHLWYDFLRDYPVKFLRQKPFGNYILDFYCAKAKLAIELDGSQHFTEQSVIDKDKQRDIYLKEHNITVIRIQNIDITNNFKGVCDYIDSSVKNLCTHNPSVSTADSSLYTREPL